MRKQAKYTYQKINQDTSKSKHSNTLYWDAKNIRVLTNEEFGAVTNQKGNELVFTIPTITEQDISEVTKDLSNIAFPITDSKIIHSEKIAEKVILFCTTSTPEVTGVETIWLLEKINNNIESTLLYIDKLGFHNESHLESVGIDENNESQKVYWVDGENEVRFINIKDSNLINKEPSEISVTPRATLLDPDVTGYSSGGSHKAGVIQYAYNLYNKYGAQTKISGLSELVALQNDDKGSPLDAPINKSPNVKIDNIPQNFEYIKVYSVFYSSLGQTPKISLIYENDNTSESLEITDTNDIIQEVSLNEFNIIGTQSIIPKHISNKDGHLFFGDYKTKKFDFAYDARAFSFTTDQGGWFNTFKHSDSKYNDIYVYDNSFGETQPTGSISLQEFLDTVPFDHDVINDNPDAIYKNENVIGAIGKNVSVEIKYKDNNINTSDTSSLSTSLKRGEKYRIGLVGYNDRDEESFVKWITDIKIPTDENILDGDNARLAYLEVELNNLPEEVKAYRLVKVKRLEKDKTIKAQGILNPTLETLSGDGSLDYSTPSYFTRHFSSTEKNNIITDSQTGGGLTRLVNNVNSNRARSPIRFNTSRTSLETIVNGTPNYGLFEVNLEGEITRLSNVTDNYNRITEDSIEINREYFTFNSSEILQKQNKLNISNTDKFRIVGFSQESTGFYNVKFFNSFNSDIEEADVDNRKSYTGLGSPFMYQVNKYNLFVDKFFRPDFESPEDLELFLPIIGSPRIPFITALADTDPAVYPNNWEFKKSFYIRNFLEDIIIDFNTESDINLDFPITFIPSIADTFNIPDGNTSYIFSNDINIRAFSEFKSIGNSCLLFKSEDLYSDLETSFNNLSSTNKNKNNVIIGEFYNDNEIIYGGNTFAARQRNQYIPLSKKQLAPTTTIDSVYGDTYIQHIYIPRIFYTNNFTAETENSITEIVSYIGETYINNDMRHDSLKNENGENDLNTENAFLYNEVYGQENDLIKSISKPFNFTLQEEFKSEVIASPKKILGEFIDNWTTVSINDRITLDTKYGEITGFAKLNDTLYTFQRNGIAYLAINPRVQLSTNDNIPIQLGSGKLIERYQYINTESGTLHPRSITATESGIFYFDTLNYSINRLTGNKEEISLTKGLYNYIKDFSINNFDDLFPITRVVTHYDNKNEEVYFTFNTGEDDFTVAYNLLADGFVSFYDFRPNVYFNINNSMYTVPSDNTVWQHDTGDYSTFYNTYYPSSITLLFNEDADYDKVLDNLSFITNVTENGDDKVNITFNDIKVDNSYQSTDVVPLQIGKNLRRKFREFHITIPRQSGTRNRIRGEYALIKLTFDYPANNYKLVLNDSIVSYTLS